MQSRVLNTFVSKLLIALINFAMIVMLSRYLGAAGRGLAALIIVNLHYVSLSANVLSGSSLVFFGSRHSAIQLLAPAAIWSLVCALAAYFIFNNPNSNLQEFALPIGIIAALQALGAATLHYLLGRNKVLSNNALMLIQSCLLILLLGGFFYFQWHEIDAFIRALELSYAALFVISLFFIARDLKGSSLKVSSMVLKEQFSYGIQNQLAHVFQFTAFRICYFLLESNSGLEELGIFSNAVALAESVWLVSRSMAMVGYAEISNLRESSKILSLTKKAMRTSVALSVGLCLVLFFIPEDFFTWIFGQAFTGIRKPMIFLLPGVAVFSVFFVLSSYFSGKGLFKVNTLISLGSMIITGVISVILVPRYGMQGAAQAYSIGLILSSILIYVVFIRLSKHHQTIDS